jgi:xanthine dehydrogenase accessory factor
LDPDAKGAVAGRKGLWRPGAAGGADSPGPAWEPVMSLALEQGSAGIFRLDDQPEVLFLQPLGGQPVVYLFGGGHISLYLAPLVKLVGFGLVVVEDRPEFCNPERFPQADRLLVRPAEKALEGLELGLQSYVVIVTRGHLHDKEVLAQALHEPGQVQALDLRGQAQAH